MKILLINISLRPESKVIYIPLGLAYVASALKNRGYKFDFLDIDAYRYSNDYVVQYLKKHQYDVICMGCIVTGYKFIKDLACRIKQFNRHTIVIVGNSVASSIPDILLTKTEVDVAVIGEGDVTIVEVLDALRDSRSLNNVAGIWYKHKGSIIKSAPRPVIESIDTIPFPDWDLFNIEKYIEACSKYGASNPLPLPRERIRAFTISTARGCPIRCSFCYHVFRDAKFRYISPSILVKEIKRLKEKYKINYFIFHDDLSLVSKKHASEIARCFLQEKIDIFWVASCRANLFNQESDIELAEYLNTAGCVGLGYSLESSNLEILKMMNKKLDPVDFSKQSQILDKAGINRWTSLVFGYPFETKETIKGTINCCIENGIYPSSGYLLPQPATPMYDYAIKHGFIRDEEEYLLAMGDRQDFRLNMTKMSDEEFKDTVSEALEECNKKLKLNLGKASLMKTGYYRAVKDSK